MRGLFTDSPNLSVVTVIENGPPATASIRLSMGQILTNLIVLKAALSNGLFLRDSSGTNQVIINSNGTATRDLLADGQFTITGNAVIGASASVLTNKILGNGANEGTIDDNLKVTGALSCDGNLQAANMEATGILNVQGNLTVGGSMPRPFWVAGKVDGNKMSVLKSNGRYGFTATRPSGFGTGVYEITFDTPAPDAHYVISIDQQITGNIKIWDSHLPTTTEFHMVSFNQTWNLINCIFRFTVYAG
jgi:hypothetical protein